MYKPSPCWHLMGNFSCVLHATFEFLVPYSLTQETLIEKARKNELRKSNAMTLYRVYTKNKEKKRNNIKSTILKAKGKEKALSS